MRSVQSGAGCFTPKPRDYVELLQNFSDVGSGSAPTNAERTYAWLMQHPSYANALKRFRRMAVKARTDCNLPPTFNMDGERKLLRHMAWLLVECNIDLMGHLPRKLDDTTARRRVAAANRLSRLQGDFADGIRLADGKAQASLEKGVSELLSELTRARRRYSGDRVHNHGALARFAEGMHSEFAWCAPAFLADIAAVVGISRDQKTFVRISKATRQPWSYLKP